MLLLLCCYMGRVPCFVESSRPHARWLPIAGVIYLLVCWAAILAVTWKFTGLFYVIGIDFSMFHAATRTFIENGSVSAYSLDSIAGFMEPFWAHYHPDVPELKVRPVPYPPVFHLIMVPFSLLPPVASMLAWTLFNAALVALVARDITRRFHGNTQVNALTLILSIPITIGLIVGQPIGIVLFICYQIFAALEHGEDMRAGLWIGCLLLKPQLAICILLVLIYKKRWHALAGAAASRGAIALLSFAVLGKDGLLVFYRTILGYATGFQEIDSPTAAYHMISWRGAVASLGTGLSEHQGIAITALLTLATLPALLIVWRGDWRPGNDRFAARMLATGILTALVGYDMHIHGAVVLVVPAMVLLLSGQGSPLVQAIMKVSLFALPLIALSLTMLALVLVVLMLITLISILVEETISKPVTVPGPVVTSNA